MSDIYMPDGECPELMPTACTDPRHTPHYAGDACTSVRIVGADDVTINQGLGIDLTDGVTAYDGEGNEIEYTVEPPTIDKCEVGEHEVRYTATGVGTSLMPKVPCIRPKLHRPDTCAGTDFASEIRTITIEQADPPVIDGVDSVVIAPNTDFDPLSGVSATDDNGNPVSVEYEGMYAAEDDGDIVEFETQIPADLLSAVVTLEPHQDGTPRIGTSYDTEPYVTRALGSVGLDVGNREYDEIVGGTVAWNQLNNNTAATSTGGGVTFTNNGDGSWTLTGSGTATTRKQIMTLDPPIPMNHVVFMKHGADIDGSNSTFYICVSHSGSYLQASRGTSGNIIKLEKTDEQFSIRTFSGFVAPTGGLVLRPQIIDLTSLFADPTIADYIYSLEQGQEGAGVAWFRKRFPKDYYEYCAPTLMSVRASAHVMKDASDNVIASYPLDPSLELRGIPKLSNGKLYYDGDTYASSGLVTRNTILRAYQSGDENLANAITDGTNTVVYSANASTEQAAPFTNPQIVDDFGTESYTVTEQSGVAVPVGHRSHYAEEYPISGHDSVTAHRTGKNLWGGLKMANDIKVAGGSGVALDTDEKTLKITAGTAISGKIVFTNEDYPFKENTAYTFIIYGYKPLSASTGYLNIKILFTNGTSESLAQPRSDSPSYYVFSTSASKTVEKIQLEYRQGTYTMYYEQSGIFEGVLTADDFEPYHGDEYMTDLGQTVYGGTLDVVSGKLTVTWAEVDLGWLTWTYNATIQMFVADVTNMASGVRREGIMCPIYPISTTSNLVLNGIDDKSMIRDNGRIIIRDDSYTNATAFASAMNGIQLVYELADPMVDHLTPQQISALVGTNVVWSDEGEILVKYLKDTRSGTVQYSTEGIFPIVYHAEDECGNETIETRAVIVTNDVNTMYTVLFHDGTLVFNVPVSEMAKYVDRHGYAEYVYPPLDENHDYEFAFGGIYGTTAYWYSQRDKVISVEFATPISPTSTKLWFYACYNAVNLDFTNLDTSNVTDMGYMFAYVSVVETLDLSTFDTSNVTNMYQMFAFCEKLKSINMSGWDTSNVGGMTYMFRYCESLESIDVSMFNTENVTAMDGMFGNCTSLVTIDLSNFSTPRVQYVNQLLQKCTSLETVWFGSGWDMSHVVGISAAAAMFTDDSALETIYSPIDWNYSGSTSMFNGCTSIVGGNGTTYQGGSNNSVYAKIDRPGTMGYFTQTPNIQ